MGFKTRIIKHTGDALFAVMGDGILMAEYALKFRDLVKDLELECTILLSKRKNFITCRACISCKGSIFKKTKLLWKSYK